MVNVVRKGILIDVRNKQFPEVLNYPKEKAWDVIKKALKRKLVEYTLNHNVSVLVAKDLSKSNIKTKSKIATKKVSKFALKEYLDHLMMLAERANVELRLINPAHTSTVGKMIAKDFGLDVHTSSSYTLALKFINSH